jgi:hypothetical protein
LVRVVVVAMVGPVLLVLVMLGWWSLMVGVAARVAMVGCGLVLVAMVGLVGRLLGRVMLVGMAAMVAVPGWCRCGVLAAMVVLAVIVASCLVSGAVVGMVAMRVR